jgi:hypothetical protein
VINILIFFCLNYCLKFDSATHYFKSTTTQNQSQRYFIYEAGTAGPKTPAANFFGLPLYDGALAAGTAEFPQRLVGIAQTTGVVLNVPTSPGEQLHARTVYTFFESSGKKSHIVSDGINGVDVDATNAANK